jgi:phosphoglycolate phosphatase-like HAD superfamily hydrolase
MLRAVVFDLGGTLLHYESASAGLRELNTRGFAALYHYLSSSGRTAVPEAAVLNAIASHVTAEWQAALASSRGSSIETPLKAALAELGISLSDGEWQAARRAFYAPIQGAAEPRQGVRPTLQALNEQGVAATSTMRIWHALICSISCRLGSIPVTSAGSSHIPKHFRWR